jgi:hypothetical protein
VEAGAVSALSSEYVLQVLDQVLADSPARTELGLKGVQWAVYEAKARIEAAAAATEAQPAAPVARRADPWTSQVAARRVEPSRGTRKAQVLNRLRQAGGDWVPGTELATVQCGGGEGLRRLRELRTSDGWPIERRPAKSGLATRFEYRLPFGAG